MSRRRVSVLPEPRPRFISVGTAHPSSQFAQEAIADLLDVPEGLPRRFFRTAGIDTRYLYLPVDGNGTLLHEEEEGMLLARHRRGCLELGRQAIERCLEPIGLTPHDIDYLCCVSSTGFMLPGLTAMYIRHLGFDTACQRADVVGMGCNALLNGVNVASGWCVANPGRYALVICCEINSAIYVRDERPVTALVNSLFGDGCAAVALSAGPAGPGPAPAGGPEILGFCSHVVPDAWRAISYHWSDEHDKFELYLDKDIPAVLGRHSPTPITALLDAFTMCRCDVAHWLVHAGGRKVISAIGESNGLDSHALRHASNVLRRVGNLGSATVMFSYEDLVKEATIAPGDYGVMVTMGPGATIETALVRW